MPSLHRLKYIHNVNFRTLSAIGEAQKLFNFVSLFFKMLILHFKKYFCAVLLIGHIYPIIPNESILNEQRILSEILFEGDFDF